MRLDDRMVAEEGGLADLEEKVESVAHATDDRLCVRAAHSAR